MQGFEILMFAGLFLFGILATVVYYFARYYFKMGDADKEVIRDQAVDISDVLNKDTLAPQSPSAPVAPPVPVSPPVQKSLSSALEKTKSSIWGRLRNIVGGQNLSAELREEIEEVLYTSDLGPQTVQRLLGAIDESLQGADRSDVEKVRGALRSEMLTIFTDNQGEELRDPLDQLKDAPKPQVWMIVGVNGAGKTTTIGKLARRASDLGLKVMVVAGDTFRAAAGDQLKVWTERAQVEIFSPEGVKDPSAVAFDGCASGKARGFDLIIVDTAGRLHTQDHLMEELKKIKRVIQKVIPEAPHQSFIVLDANSGQNAMMQARQFHQAIGLNGAILTKLDGSAKGGVAVGLACELQLPIPLIGVGESIEDLRVFNPKEFVDSII